MISARERSSASAFGVSSDSLPIESEVDHEAEPFTLPEQDDLPATQAKPPKIPVYPELSSDFVILWCCLSLASYIGALTRLSFLVFKVWWIEVNYVSSLWVNVLGCVIMGFVRKHYSILFEKSISRFFN
jgi:hypothetical protein